ncbi:MAG TPA: glycosyltransferase family 4 protein [Solirubrobacteraceae bacterium]|nr:glycosyltransferase family 4 protein [Solirubrobacteraceae bacterium]
MKPVLLVTNHVPPDRAGAFAALAARVPLRLALFAGPSLHATAEVRRPQELATASIAEHQAYALAASGDFSFVVAGTAGRRALPAAFAGARRSGTPFVFWSALWHQPRSAAHLGAAPLMRAIHARAHAIVTYGPHVSAFARRLGARRVHEAPQAVDGAFWAAPAPAQRRAGFQALFAGRDAPEKGLAVLRAAWPRAALEDAALVVAGPPAPMGEGVVSPEHLRNLLGGSDVVVVPSLRTRTFREPWGLICNEAMHRHVPVIASSEVGAAAGGLVRHERNGLVTPAGDPRALAGALGRLHAEHALRDRLGAAAARDAAPYTQAAWATGFAQAFR